MQRTLHGCQVNCALCCIFNPKCVIGALEDRTSAARGGGDILTGFGMDGVTDAVARVCADMLLLRPATTILRLYLYPFMLVQRR